MKVKQYPTQEELNSLFRYDNLTGLLYYKRLPSKYCKYKILDQPCGCINKSTGYYFVNYQGGKYAAHRIIWIMHNGNIPTNNAVDHINGKKSDNRLENLQLLTIYENSIKDMIRPNPTNYIGVRKKRNRYQSFFFNNGKEKYLGSYLTEKSANSARRRYIS